MDKGPLRAEFAHGTRRRRRRLVNDLIESIHFTLFFGPINAPTTLQRILNHPQNKCEPLDLVEFISWSEEKTALKFVAKL